MTATWDLGLVADLDRAVASRDAARLDPELARRLAAESARIAEALAILGGWLDEGLLAESVAYAEDSGGLVRRAAEIERIVGVLTQDEAGRRFLSSVGRRGSIDRRLIERLNVAYVSLRSRAEEQRARVAAALAARPPLERLAVLDRLRALDRRDASVAAEIDLLERAAESAIRRAARDAASRGDLPALEAVERSLRARSWARILGEDLGTGIARDLARLRSGASHRDLAALADSVHGAFAAMDRPALDRLEPAWRALVASLPADEAQGPRRDLLERGESAFRWTASLRREESLDLDAARLSADLERSLDSGAAWREVEPIAAALGRTERPTPPRLLVRVEALRGRHDAEMTRRRRVRAAVVGGVVLIAASAISLGAWRLARERAALASAEDLDRLVAAGELVAAEALLADLDATGRAGDAWLPASRDRMSRSLDAARAAVATDRDRRAAVAALLAQAESLLEAQGDDAARRGAAESALRLLAGAGPRGGEVEEAAALESRARESLAQLDERRAVELRALLAELERTLAAQASPPPNAGPAEVAAALAAVDLVRDEARAGIDAAPVPATERASIDLFLDRLAARREGLTRRVEGLADLDRLLGELLAEDADEERFAAAYRALLDRHGAVLAARGLAPSYEAGLAAADAALGIRQWREVASRSIRATTPPDDPFHPEDRGSARAVASLVREHLERFPRSPHADAARRLGGHAERLAALPDDALDERSLAAARLLASGFATLERVPLANGGFVYRRAGGAGVLDGALSSELDLLAPPGTLSTRTDLPAPPSGTPVETMPARLLRTHLPRLAAVPGSAVRREVLALAKAASAEADDDPLMQLAFLRLVWSVHATLPGPEADVSAAWREDLSTGRLGDRSLDWVKVAPEGRAALAAARRAARLAIGEAPDAAAASDREDLWWRELVSALRPAVPAGTLRAEGPNGPFRGAGDAVLRGGAFVVVLPRDGGPALLVGTTFEDGAASFAGPPPAAAPAQLFLR
ncbi:MAG: hypothetical protein FJ257_00575 [Phycisphaerae bacterium]|nr:hypothetical protein [Phycisphaerae bacterium]